MSQGNSDESRLEQLSRVKTPDEFIRIFRSMTAEENQEPEENIFPLDDDAASDILHIMMGVWLAMCAEPPLETKEEVVAAMERMTALLKRKQRHLSDDQEQLKRDMLLCMRRGVTPDHWPRIK